MLTREFFESKSFRRLVIMALLVLVLIAIRSILNLILVTFIITFLMDRLQLFLTSRLNKMFPVDRKVVIAFMYISLGLALVVGIYRYFPVIINQISQLIKFFSDFEKNPPQNEIVVFLVDMIRQFELAGHMEKGFNIFYKYITNIGKWGIHIFLALILSLFFLLEKSRIMAFTSQFKNSKISEFYNEIEYFGKRFVRSFGKVIEVQFLIALINCVLTVIALWIMGFPQLFALALMVFLLGLIPVAGVIISLIPLCTIAYSIGGFIYVVYLIVVIAIVHAIESYFLNPKLMSSKTNLPVFYTFIVLICGEHFFGVWGLIVGIPMFIFLLDVIGVHREETD